MGIGTRSEQQGSYTATEGRADRQHAERAAQEEGRVKTRLRDVEVAGEQPPVQLLDIKQLDAEVEAARIHRPF